MNKIKYFLPLLFFILLGFFLMRGIELNPTELPSPLINKPMPEFSLLSLEDDRLLSVKNIKGQLVLLNVWATWCVSCKMEHPYLLELAKRGVVIAGLSYKDDSDKAKQWLSTLGNPYLFNIVDHAGTLGLDLGVFGAPETFLIDRDGIIRYKHVGVIDERVWQQQLAPIYNQYNELHVQ